MEHICPDCNHLVSEHKEFFCEHVYCRCNISGATAEVKYKLKVAIETLRKIRGENFPNGVPSAMIADEALKEIDG